jgi:transposase
MGEVTEGKFVRIAEMQQKFKGKTGVTYKSSGFYKLLKRHDWRKVMPRGKHPKKSREKKKHKKGKHTDEKFNFFQDEASFGRISVLSRW